MKKFLILLLFLLAEYASADIFVPVSSDPIANATSTGYLSSTDWIKFNSAGPGLVTSVSGTAPVSVANPTTTPVVSMSVSNTTTNGYLTSTDWTAFNGKAASGANADITALSHVTKLYPASDGTSALQVFKADGTTSVLNVDTTNKRLGIGSATPAVALDVVSTVANLSGLVVASNTNNATDQIGIIAKGASDNDAGIGLFNTSGGGSHWLFRANHNGNFEFIDIIAGQLDMFIQQTTGNVSIGPGSSAPQAALDIRGAMRLNIKYAFGSPPVACDATHDGLMFLSTTYHLCVCKSGSTAYVLTSDGSSACS